MAPTAPVKRRWPRAVVTMVAAGLLSAGLGGVAVAGGDVGLSDQDGAPGTELGPRVVLAGTDTTERSDDFPRSYAVLDELEPNTVLQMQVRDFPRFATARAAQCVTTDQPVCGNVIPVQFDEDGTATFQYLVTDDFAAASRAGRCGGHTAPCSVVVETLDGGTRAEQATIFAEPRPPPGVIQVEPDAGLVDGQTVTVEVARFPPGVEVRAMLCAAPAATGATRCGPPGPTTSLRVGPDGRGSTELVIETGPVGSEGAHCGRRGLRCGVSVASPEVFTYAPVAPITFAGPSGPAYDPWRLAVGLGAGALLLGIAAVILRLTDWSPPGEVAAPEIDEADYADLDAIVAALPPEEESRLDGERE